ncbi:glycosyltransferase family 2 protein [Mycoplasmatota bacterium zrk1]
MDKKLVSIILPTYRRKEKFKRALSSLVNQTYRAIEILVIDDNYINAKYKCDIQDIIENFSDSRIRYIDLEGNRGASVARNKGLIEAKGDYITFLDDDDYYRRDKIELQVNKFTTSKTENIGLIYCFMKSIGKIYTVSSDFRVNDNRMAIKTHFLRSLTGTPAIMIKREIVEQSLKFTDIPSSQDFTFIHDILILGYNVDYVDKILVFYDISGEDRISTSQRKIEGIYYRYDLINDFVLSNPNFFEDKVIKKIRKKELYHKSSYSAKIVDDYLKQLIRMYPFSFLTTKLVTRKLLLFFKRFKKK